MWKIYYTTYKFEYVTQHDRSTQRKQNHYNNKIRNRNKNYALWKIVYNTQFLNIMFIV